MKRSEGLLTYQPAQPSQVRRRTSACHRSRWARNGPGREADERGGGPPIELGRVSVRRERGQEGGAQAGGIAAGCRGGGVGSARGCGGGRASSRSAKTCPVRRRRGRATRSSHRGVDHELGLVEVAVDRRRRWIVRVGQGPRGSATIRCRRSASPGRIATRARAWASATVAAPSLGGRRPGRSSTSDFAHQVDVPGGRANRGSVDRRSRRFRRRGPGTRSPFAWHRRSSTSARASRPRPAARDGGRSGRSPRAGPP